jgi:hypothetical protein
LAEFLVRNGQALLPMLELIEQSRLAIDELIDVMGRASLEAVLALSAQQVAGLPQQGKARHADFVWHGTQAGRVYLRERQLPVNKPRLHKKGRGANKEVPVPAYQAMQHEAATGERMLEILLHGVSTRRYQRVIPAMADTVGGSKSGVSRETIEASEATLEQLMERRFDDLDLLIIYIDGMRFQDQCVLAAVGVDVEGRKHVLGLREGATENAEAAKDLLQHNFQLRSGHCMKQLKAPLSASVNANQMVSQKIGCSGVAVASVPSVRLGPTDHFLCPWERTLR